MRILRESKESTLKRQVLLTDEQRDYLIKLFNKYNYLWSLLPSDKLNKGNLEWSDCKEIIEQAGKSKTARKKKGISGLKEGYDYIFLGEGFNETIGNYLMYQPLTYKGSKVLASNNVEPKKGNGAQWCVAYQKSYTYWQDYSFKNKCKFLYLMTDDTKYAVAVYPDRVEAYTFEDENIKYPDWCKNDEIIQKAMKELKEPQPIKEINLEDYIVKNPDGTVSLSLIKKGIYLNEGEYKDIENSFYKIIKSYIKDGRFTVKFKEWDADFNCSFIEELVSLKGCPDYVRGSFKIIGCNNLTTLEGASERVDGDFDCSCCIKLKSLNGVPEYIGGYFKCQECIKLTSLEGLPTNIKGDFCCNYCNRLTSLEGAPREVGGKFSCHGCKGLLSLDGAPEKIGGNFDCGYCIHLTSLNGAPKEVGGYFDCSTCRNLTSLIGAPEKVGGGFYCDFCSKLTSLEGCPNYVKGPFSCKFCKNLTSLVGVPEKVGGHFDCSYCNGLISLEGAPKEVGRNFICYDCKRLTSYLKHRPEILGGHFIH